MRKLTSIVSLAVALLASGVLIASAAPVSYRGLTCDVLGSAASVVANPDANAALLQVSNIGSSGQDGVSVTLPDDCSGWQCAFGARPPGTVACDQMTMRLLDSSTPGTAPFGTYTQTLSAGAVHCVLDCPTATRWVVQVWSGSTLAYSASFASAPTIDLPSGVAIADSGSAVSASGVVLNMRSRINSLESLPHLAGSSMNSGGAVINTSVPPQQTVGLETVLKNLGLLIRVNGAGVTGDRVRVSAVCSLALHFQRIEMKCLSTGGNGGFSVANHGPRRPVTVGQNAPVLLRTLLVNDGATITSVLPGTATRVTLGGGLANWRATYASLLLPAETLHDWGADYTPIASSALAGGATLECRAPSTWSGTADLLKITAQDDGSGPSLALVNTDATKIIDVCAYSGATFTTLSSSAPTVPVSAAPTGWHELVSDGDLVVRCPMPAGAYTLLGGAFHPCDSLEFRVHRPTAVHDCDGLQAGTLTGHALDHLDFTQCSCIRADQFSKAQGSVLRASGDSWLESVGGDIVVHDISELGGGVSISSPGGSVLVPLVNGPFLNGDIPSQEDFTAQAVASDGSLAEVADLLYVYSHGTGGNMRCGISATFDYQTSGRVFVELDDGTVCDPLDLDSNGDGLMDFRQLVAGTTSLMGSVSYRHDSPWTEVFDVAFTSTMVTTYRGIDRHVNLVRIWRNHGGEHVGTSAPEPQCVNLNGLPPGTPFIGTLGVSGLDLGAPAVQIAGTQLEAHGAGSTIDGFPTSPTWAFTTADGDPDFDWGDGIVTETGLAGLERVHTNMTIDRRFGAGVGEPEGPLRGCAFTINPLLVGAPADSAGMQMTLAGTLNGVPLTNVLSYGGKKGYDYWKAHSNMAAASLGATPVVQVFSGGVLQSSFVQVDSLPLTNPPGSVVCIVDDGTGKPVIQCAGFPPGTLAHLSGGDVPCDRVTYLPNGSVTPATFAGDGSVVLKGLPVGIPVTGIRLAGIPTASSLLAVGPALSPNVFALSRPWPNPVRGPLNVSFSLPAAARVHAGVYDVAGRAVATLADARFAPGAHALRWDGRLEGGAPAPAGLYFLRVTRDGRDAHTARFTRLP